MASVVGYRIPTSNWNSIVRSMPTWTVKGNNRALSLPMYKMGDTPNTNARTDRNKKKQPVLLSRRESAI